jgi:DNA-binding SARP family transcriptional activator
LIAAIRKLPMNALHITLFGKISIQQAGQPCSALSAKALELLCYLLVYRERAHTRETLAAVLWPEASSALAQKYLRQTLWQLQTALDEQATAAEPQIEGLFILHPGWVRINPQADWSVDVAIFEQTYTVCCDQSGEILTAAQAHRLEAAVQLYQGDFMATWYPDWCIYERERLQLIYLAMLETLMGYCEWAGLYTKGIAYGQSVLRYDRAREGTHRQLMRLYYKAGDRTTALRQFERCASAVQKEFSLPPTQETIALYAQIRADHLGERPTSPTDSFSPVDLSTADLSLQLRQRLDQIQSNLMGIQQQLQAELTAIRRVLSTATEEQ